MTPFRAWYSRLAAHFGRERRDQELASELESHVQLEMDELIRRGHDQAGARRIALARAGGLEAAKDAYRDQRGLPGVDQLTQDVRYGLRALRRSPGHTAVIVVMLALGIGANTAVFSWMEGILLRPYPGVADQDRLVAVAGTANGTPGYSDMSWQDYQDLASASTHFSSFIASKIIGTTLTGGDRAERAVGQMVSANYFDALGVRPVPGRAFAAGDDIGRNSHPEAVIGYRLWQDRFGGDPAVIGKTQILNGVPFTIIGVAPREFVGTFVGYSMQFWVPASMQGVFDLAGYRLDDRNARWIEGLARLKPGVTITEAQAEIDAGAKRLARAFPDADRGRGARLLPLWDAPFDNAKELLPMLRAAAVVVLFVLLIACANVANLLLARALGRRHEMTVRLAVGAGRKRLIRQLVTEGAILSLIATGAGLAVAYWSRNILSLFFAPRGGVPVMFSAYFDWRVLGLSAAVGLASTLAFALVPALQASNVDLAGVLKADSRSALGGRDRSKIRSSLVIVQVSLSFILLVGAALLLTSLQRTRRASPGFRTDGVLLTGLNMFAVGYDTLRARIVEDQALERMRAISGVQTVAFARSTPFTTRPYDSGPVVVDGYIPAPDERPTADYNVVTPGYFSTLGIPFVSGRDFARSDEDTSAAVAIVTEAMATRYWPGLDPLGRRLQASGRWMTVVGEVKDIKYSSLLEAARPLYYVPLRQRSSTVVGVFMRSSVPVAAIGPALVREIHSLDPNLSPSELLPIQEQVDRSMAPQRIAVALLGVFGTLALLLAAIGIYGVMSYAVSQATRELGLRMALGATPSGLLRMVVARGFVLTGTGVALGAATALGTTRLLGDLLYKVSPRDPVAFGAAFALIALSAAVACIIPAYRAARTDPVQALRLGC
jgi:macrolide transport system ATP-binding/permease protein